MSKVSNQDNATESPDYYFENGLMVMTEAYHLKRGTCCGNGCKHCPYQKESPAKES